MRTNVPLGMPGALLGACLASGCLSIPSPPAIAPVQRFEFEAPADPSPLHLAVAPDGGEVVAWTISGDNRMALWSRSLSDSSFGAIAGSERARDTASGFPFWSPDSTTIALFGNRSLQVMDRRGSPLRTLARAPFGHGGTWSRDNAIVYAPDKNGPLYLITADEAAATPITALDQSRGEIGHRHPCFLPDGRHFIFFVASRREEYTGIRIGSLDGGEPRFLLHTATKAVFAPPGTLLYMQGSTLLARAFDPQRLEFTGAPVPLAGGVATNPDNGAAGFAVSANGVLAYRTAQASSRSSAAISIVVNWPALLPPD